MERIKNLNKTTKSNIITYAIVVIAFVVIQALLAAHAVSHLIAGLLVPICAYVCLSISLNLVVGVSGELSLGHAGFMSVGAFSGLVVASIMNASVSSAPLCLLVSIVAAGLFAAIAGLLVGLPVMRLYGDYLAIVTLAFGEIIKNLFNNLYVGIDAKGLHFSVKGVQALGMDGGKILINGPGGAVGIPQLSSFVAGFILILFTLFVVLNLINSRAGRAVMAVRDNRIAAESVGINVTKYRLIAFVVSAALAGMAGALYAMNFSSIAPKKFDFNTSILILVFVVLGGIGKIRGGMIAAVILTVLPEQLRFIGQYRMLIYSVVLIVVMIVTNNPTIQRVLDDFKERFRRRGNNKVAQATDSLGGGTSNE